MLPDATGAESLTWVRQNLGWDLPVIVVTARDDGATVCAALGAGAGDQVVEPAKQGKLLAGHAPTWSRQALTHVLEEHARHCRRLGWIDLHTELGPSGHGERIFADRNHAAPLRRARAWWGPQVASMYDGSSASVELTGLLFNAACQACPQAEYTGIALEFGTRPMLEVMAMALTTFDDALGADVLCLVPAAVISVLPGWVLGLL
jgi:CheY-like chemotaxis protein